MSAVGETDFEFCNHSLEMKHFKLIFTLTGIHSAALGNRSTTMVLLSLYILVGYYYYHY